MESITDRFLGQISIFLDEIFSEHFKNIELYFCKISFKKYFKVPIL